jgi:hypothetical protein
LFDITAQNMKLSLENTTVMAGLGICTPIIRFFAVAHALDLFATDGVRCDRLGSLNPLRPTLNHPDTVVGDKAFAHD